MKQSIPFSLLLFIYLIASENMIIGQTPNPDMWITDGSVYAIVVDGGSTYIGGSFTWVGPNTGRGVKLTSASHSPNLSFPIVNGAINTAVPDGSGGWYIGGAFTMVGSATRNRIARINADGTVHSWNPNANNDVFTIAINGTDIYVGGSFTSIGGQTRNYLAKLNNSIGTADGTWNPNANAPVRTISISGGGTDIYVGGDFSNVGGQTRNYLAKLENINGTAAAWNPNASNSVRTISISGYGADIYVGGYFTSVGGQTRNRLAKLSTTTGVVDAWDPNANNAVHAISVSGANIYVGGDFTSVGVQSRNYIAKLNNTTGAADGTWDANAGASVRTLSISGDGADIYAGGLFTTINGGTARNRLAKLNNSTGAADALWDPNAGSTVNTIAISGSDLYVGGSFITVGFLNRNNLAKLSNINGTADAAWNPNAGGLVLTMAVSGANIYVGGDFTSVGGQSRNRLAKLNNSTGAADASWNPNASALVRTMIISGDGADIYVGGNFTSVGGQSRNRLAKLDNINGTAATWNPNASGSVRTIAISGEFIYVGGDFINIGGQSRSFLAKLNALGTAESWNPDADDAVYSITLSGADIYACGNFQFIGGQSRNSLAKLNSSTGTADPTWNPNANSLVNTLSISGDGADIYVGGNFTTINGSTTRNKLAKLNNTTGAADPTWNPNAENVVYSITISGSDIYVGGSFLTMGGVQQQKFALFTNRVLPVELLSFAANVNAEDVRLRWETATEMMNYGFEIERRRKSDASDWQKIGFVPGSGNSNSTKSYGYTDADLSSGTYQYRLKQIDTDGGSEYSGIVEATIGTPTEYSLYQNYPNPFNPSTSITFSVPKSGFVSLAVYNLLGEKVTDLVNKTLEAGTFTIDYDASGMASGLYFYSLQAGEFSAVKKMILTK